MHEKYLETFSLSFWLQHYSLAVTFVQLLMLRTAQILLTIFTYSAHSFELYFAGNCVALDGYIKAGDMPQGHVRSATSTSICMPTARLQRERERERYRKR